MSLAWSPDRPGNWIFQCHDTAHTTEGLHDFLGGPHSCARRCPRHHEPGRHAEDGMAGLVLGIHVEGAAPSTCTYRLRAVPLLVQERAGVYGKEAGLGYALLMGPRTPRRLRRNSRPTARTLTVGQRPTKSSTECRKLLPYTGTGCELRATPMASPTRVAAPGAMAPAIQPADSFHAHSVASPAQAPSSTTRTWVDWQIDSGLYAPADRASRPASA